MPVYTEKQNLSARHNANKHACKANKQTNREGIMRQTMHACKANKQRRNYEQTCMQSKQTNEQRRNYETNNACKETNKRTEKEL